MTAGTKAIGTFLQRATQVPSHLHTGVVGNNNAILWTAVTEGTAGDSITVDLDNPGGNGSLVITVTGTDIVVTLARAAGVITSTAADVIAAIKANASASDLVTPCNDSTSTGAGLVVDTGGAQSLASGSDTIIYDTIAEVKTVGGPSLKLGTVETTHLTSTNGWKTFIATVKEMAQFTLGLNLLLQDETHNYIYGLIKDNRHGILRAFRIIFTDASATTWDFSAYATDVDVTGISPEGVVSANVTLRPSGQPTLA